LLGGQEINKHLSAMVATFTGAERLLQVAVENGIEVCFANPGNRDDLCQRFRMTPTLPF
jgi:hypothetical protein